MSFSRSVCFVHAQREAVARCRTCGRSFCRECVTEHEGVLRCTKCLRIEIPSRRSNGLGLQRFSFVAIAVASTVLGLLAIMLLTRQLGNIPASFHDGSIWK